MRRPVRAVTAALLAALLAALVFGGAWSAFVSAQPVHPRLRSLTGRYLALPERNDALEALAKVDVDLVGLEARLELLSELREVDWVELDPDDRIDHDLLTAMLQRDLYWLIGPDAEPAPPLPGFLYGRILDPDRRREEVLAHLPRDLEAMVRALGSDGRALGEPSAGRRRRWQLLSRFLEERLPVMLAHAGPYRREIHRAAAQLKQRVQAVGRRAGFDRAAPSARRGETWPEGVGEIRFRFLLQRFHLVPLDPETVAEIGRSMARRTEAELRELAARMDPARSWQELARDLENDHPVPGKLPGFGQQVVDDAIRFVETRGLLTLSPDARRIRVRAWSGESRYPFAAYLRPENPGGLARVMVPDLARTDLDRAVRRQRLRDNNKAWTRVVMVHEAVPGHHVQHAAAVANPDPVRRRYYSEVTGEGWAVYAEELMARHGFYPDLETRLAQLTLRYWRSLRAVLDVGLHCRGMKPTEAVDLLRGKIGLSRDAARAEVRRYLHNPTRPGSYILGYLMIEEIRERVEARLGPDFDEKRFHDRLLALGPIPLPLARDRLLSGGE